MYSIPTLTCKHLHLSITHKRHVCEYMSLHKKWSSLHKISSLSFCRWGPVTLCILFLSHCSNTHLVEQFKHFWKDITHHKKRMRLWTHTHIASSRKSRSHKGRANSSSLSCVGELAGSDQPYGYGELDQRYDYWTDSPKQLIWHILPQKRRNIGPPKELRYFFLFVIRSDGIEAGGVDNPFFLGFSRAADIDRARVYSARENIYFFKYYIWRAWCNNMKCHISIKNDYYIFCC